MHREPRTADQALSALYEERDHLAIKISLMSDAESADPRALDALKRNLAALETTIARYRPTGA